MLAGTALALASQSGLILHDHTYQLPPMTAQLIYQIILSDCSS